MAKRRRPTSKPTKRSTAIHRSVDPDEDRLRAISLKYDLLRTTVRWIGIIALAFFGYSAIAVIAGKSTSFVGEVKAIVDLSIDRWLFLLLSGATTFAYLRERKLKQRALADVSTHIKNLEAAKVPKRISSGLTPKGLPSKEERDES